MRIEKLASSQHMPERVYVHLEGGERLRVSLSDVTELGLRAGMDLDEAELASLRSRSAAASARERSLNLLGRRQMSRAELIRKLRDKGEDPLAAEAAADAMERLGALDDAEYAASVARHYTRMGYGPGRVRAELARRGVDRQDWDGALDALPEENGSTLAALIEKKLRGRTPEEKDVKKLRDSLIRRGFSPREVRRALSCYSEKIQEEEE